MRERLKATLEKREAPAAGHKARAERGLKEALEELSDDIDDAWKSAQSGNDSNKS